MKKNIAIYIAQTWDIAINIGMSSNVVPVKFASKQIYLDKIVSNICNKYIAIYIAQTSNIAIYIELY